MFLYSFFCYDAKGDPLASGATLAEGKRELTVEADGDIARITYGFAAYAQEKQYTYGGILRRADTVEGSSGSLGAYMPVQIICSETDAD